MKTIIAGSRGIEGQNAANLVEEAMNEAWEHFGKVPFTEIVSGHCTNSQPNAPMTVDETGEWWASCRALSCKTFPADWRKHGRAAGPIRNRQMAEYADALVAVYDGKSRGTKNMIEEATKRGLKVYVKTVE